MLEELPKLILLEDLGYLYPKEDSKQKRRFGLYKCGLCGTEFRTQIYSVNKGSTVSCGCYTKKHGLINTRLYNIWHNMKKRILNPKHTYYLDYGGRGITLCDEWLDVQNFYDWAMLNGYSEDLTIDRIDNDGNYCPENCRWVTRTIQSRNQRMKKNNKSGFKGVSFRKDNNNYKAQIMVNKKRVYLGLFQTAVEAGIAYNNYIIDNNLEGFILNEIPDKKETNE